MKYLIITILLITSCKKQEIEPIKDQPKQGVVVFKWNDKQIRYVEAEVDGYAQASDKQPGNFTFTHTYGKYIYKAKVSTETGNKQYLDSVTINEVQKVIFLDK